MQRREYMKACKLPRPTRSLLPCGSRSLLEDEAFCRNDIEAPSPCVGLARLPITVLETAMGRCAAHLRPFGGVSRRFNSRCSHAPSQYGNGIPTRSRSSFPSTGRDGSPPRHRSMSTDAPANRDICPDSSTLYWGLRQPKSCCFGGHGALLPALPVGLWSDFNDGASALYSTGDSTP
jgi:hypothetical protein